MKLEKYNFHENEIYLYLYCRKITLNDINKISPLEENQMPYRVNALKAEEKFNLQNRNVTVQVFESAYRFLLGSIAGGLDIYF